MIQVEPIASDLVKRIRDRRNHLDRAVQQALDKGTLDWTSQDGVITWRDRVYVPKDAPLREEIIRLHHDSALTGHPGQYKTHELITRNYWWPGIHRDIRKYVEGCGECQRVKPIRQSPHNPLHPHDVPSEPWQVISVDLIGELPESQGYNAICVVVDHFTKQIHVLPTNTTITSEGMARLYRDHVFKLHCYDSCLFSPVMFSFASFVPLSLLNVLLYYS